MPYRDRPTEAPGEWGSWQPPASNPPHRASSAGLGIALVVIGVLFLIQQVFGFDVWHFSWPLFVIIPGVLLLFSALAGGRGASGLAVPGAIVTTTGLILLIQNTFDVWQTWAYAWALIAPTSVGLGVWLRGFLIGDARTQRHGRRLAELGLVLFLGFGIFFEGLFNISGFLRGGLGGTLIAVLLIAAGAWMLLRRSPV